MSKEDKKCKACDSFQCVGHFNMKESVYNNGVYRPATTYASQTLGSWGGVWGVKTT